MDDVTEKHDQEHNMCVQVIRDITTPNFLPLKGESHTIVLVLNLLPSLAISLILL